MSATVACTKAPDDTQIKSQLQDKLNTDSGLQGKQLSAQSQNGTVTLSGMVDNDAQRDAAARYASEIPGVKQVVNNLQIGSAPASRSGATGTGPGGDIETCARDTKIDVAETE